MNESFFDKAYVFLRNLFFGKPKPRAADIPLYASFLDSAKRAYDSRDYNLALHFFNASLQENFLSSSYRSIDAACEANRYIGLILLERDFDKGEWWEERVALDIAAHFGLWASTTKPEESAAAYLSQANMYLFAHEYDLVRKAVSDAKDKILVLDGEKKNALLKKVESLENILSL